MIKLSARHRVACHLVTEAAPMSAEPESCSTSST